ncbi:MAG: flagellar biosynthesis protein FlhA [Gammaproteobacteria bacterium]|nr:MAG: flagellar biosynthesis protein FlhA [Gammaproteobacteria bacterium]
MTALTQPANRWQVLGLGTPVLVLALLGMMILPLPPMALDVLFTFNIALALIVILMAVYSQRPLDFSVFPTILLVATLLRLALNIASTRVVLLNGHTGTDAAGQVIQSFGEFVIGGNYAVGLVVFAILVIINFAVVTKGAGRVSEVSARFTLDAMPGKQMAIDADLNAGILSQEDARKRREEVSQEADFYGSMDGASKFVRGDAVAGILILFINIIGGLIIGTVSHGMALADAATNYVLLTIGDGLVAQIPSLVLSTATAIIVTRVSAARDMGQQVSEQLLGNPRALFTAAGVVGALGLVPGMPSLVFITLAAALGGFGYLVRSRQDESAAPKDPVEKARSEPDAEDRDLSWDDVPTVDLVGLELGYRLIPLVDRSQGGSLMARIKGVRRKLSQELGFLLHPVHIRDNLELSPTGYRLSLQGVPAGEGEVAPDKELAINPGRVYGTIRGQATRDPAFGLEAVWIDAGDREEAQSLGYTVVDPATVIATHTSRILKEHAHELLGHEEVQQLLDVLARSNPKLGESLVPKTLELGVVLKVLKNLLAEEVSVRDIRSIAEALAQNATNSQDPDVLTQAVRSELRRAIVQQIAPDAAEVPLIALDPSLEQILRQSITGRNGGMAIEPGLAERLQTSVKDIIAKHELNGEPSILVVSPDIRMWMARWLRSSMSGLHVLAYSEIPDNRQVRVVATVGNDRSLPYVAPPIGSSVTQETVEQ